MTDEHMSAKDRNERIRRERKREREIPEEETKVLINE